MATMRGRVWRLGVGGAFAAVSGAAAAFPFSFGGDIDGRFDTTLSIGAQLRTQSADPALIGIANGGTARTVNEDDGDLGFDKGDFTTVVIKGSHELELKYRRDYGLFTRFYYFYDPIADGATHRESRVDANGVASADRKPNDYELGSRGRNRLIVDAELLDLFAYARFNPFGHALSLRAGKQVVNWGESTFIPNGISAFNPVDVARLRAPGSEIKEALLPTPMLWASFQATDALSVELLWITAFQETEIDPRGSYFSTTDALSDDSDKAIVTFGRRQDDNTATLNPPALDAMAWLPRDHNRTEDGMGQYGIALRWFAEALNNTEFGLYFLNYHNRTPLFSTVRGAATTTLGLAAPRCSDTVIANCRASYFGEYPGDVKLYGLSFNTNGPWGIALQGEYSYRPNQPLQLSSAEVVMAALGLSNNVTGQGFTDLDGDPTTPGVPTAAIAVAPGSVIHGYRRVDMHQMQATLTKAFGPMLGADQFVAVGDVGLTYLQLPDGLAFAAPGAALPVPGSGRASSVQPDGAAAGGSVQAEGFADETSWGYRLVGRLDYENVIGAAGVSPRLVFSHDVHGAGPTFNEGTQAITVGFSFNYLQRWQADLSYTSFFGGRTYRGTDPLTPTVPAGQPADYATSANPLKDRDFVAATLSYAF
jgi:hypothetical protein